MDIVNNLDYFKIFYQVAIDKNFTKASEKLFISQPAVSQIIKKLEDELGVVLFVRNKKGVELTEIGQEVFLQVQNALALFNNVGNIISEQKGLLKGQIVIGSSSNIANRLLAKPICEFTKRNKNIKVQHIKEPQSRMFDMLKKGDLDIVITQENPNFDLKFHPLSVEKYALVKKFGLSDEKLNFISIRAGSYANVICNKILKEKHLREQQMIVASYNLALELAVLGSGIALIPKHMAEQYLKNKTLEIAYPDVKFKPIKYGYYYNPNLITPATKAFLEILHEIKE